jgi:hypothetical protein
MPARNTILRSRQRPIADTNQDALEWRTAGQDLAVGMSVRGRVFNQPLADNWLARFPFGSPAVVWFEAKAGKYHDHVSAQTLHAGCQPQARLSVVRMHSPASR